MIKLKKGTSQIVTRILLNKTFGKPKVKLVEDSRDSNPSRYFTYPFTKKNNIQLYLMGIV